MAELISQLMSPQLTLGFIVVLLLFVGLYLLSIFWVARDAYMRDANWRKWALVAVIPIAGIIAYCLMRPPLLQIDREEQQLEIAFKQRELMKYGECGRCGYPIESTYIMCPNCHQRLKNLCPTCHNALDPEWSVCPYCTTIIQNDGIPPRKPVTQAFGVPDYSKQLSFGSATALPRGRRTSEPRNAAPSKRESVRKNRKH